MRRSLFLCILHKVEVRSTRWQPQPGGTRPNSAGLQRRATGIGGLDQAWATRLIYLAAASQLINLLLATYATQLLGYQDFLLSVFGSWGLAVFFKLLALGLWVIYREFAEARLAAWLIAPVSIFALVHDILLLV